MPLMVSQPSLGSCCGISEVVKGDGTCGEGRDTLERNNQPLTIQTYKVHRKLTVQLPCSGPCSAE